MMRLVGQGHPDGKTPTPQRITMALDLADQHGPEVDAALGVPEPTVDLWEAGKITPSPMDIERLAALTGCPVPSFYLPAPEPVGPMFLCSRSGPGKGCTVVDDRPLAPVEQLRKETLW